MYLALIAPRQRAEDGQWHGLTPTTPEWTHFLDRQAHRMGYWAVWDTMRCGMPCRSLHTTPLHYAPRLLDQHDRIRSHVSALMKSFLSPRVENRP